MSAGPKARAGFIMAPVKFPPTSASTKIARPMPNPPIFGASGEMAVPNTALTRKKVRAASIHTPCKKVTSPARWGVPPNASVTPGRGRMPLMRAAPTSAPSSWARMYCRANFPSILFAIHSPVVTAGLMCPPEMLMVIETMIAMPTPCASATPTAPVAPAAGPPPANATTLPAPRNTNNNVPTNSAVSGRRFWDITERPPERVSGANLRAPLRPPQHQRRVDAAEPERVRDHHLRGSGAPFPRQAIEVARGIGALEVDRGRQPAPLHRQRADRRLDGAAGAQRVPVVALCAAHAEPVGVRAEHLLQRLSFGRVVERRGGAVRIHVPHLAGCETAVLERELDGARRLTGVGARRGHVISVVREAVAHDLGVDLGAAGERAVPLLEHEHRRPLAHHEAIPILVERARRVRRVVVTGAHRANDAERRVGHGRKRRLGAAREHHVRPAGADRVERIAHGDRA